ncbi:MAG TPA: sigma-54 dependent transcriptional regulator [Alphaproteobacteria bacterium]|nr:sigma-54 dependent transcriptional regulator [Alphaproteobacteria bacterium]
MPHVLALSPLHTEPSLAAALPAGVQLLSAAGLEEALQTLSSSEIALLLVPGSFDLPAVFTGLKNNKLVTPVVVVGEASPATGTKAIRLGAKEYLTTPVEGRLLATLLERMAPVASVQSPVASDTKTTALLNQARQFAASGATVLLRGESGTGKEVMARFLHASSPRASKPFIAVNCAAIPESLLESELFGHEKGSFSGALNKRIGKFQQAHGGTLLLDEISEMDLALQAKLLRAIQERVIDPVGADKPVPVDIRLIATTNRTLEDYVAQGKFREDLYFRLSVVMVDLPPLRERPGDILPLARHFAEKYAEHGKLEFTPAAEEKLLTCYWKGNVRELENTIHRAILLAGPQTRTLDAPHIQISPMSMRLMAMDANMQQAGTTPTGPGVAGLAQAVAAAYSGGGGMQQSYVPRPLADVERDTLSATMSYTKGNEDFAAHLLGISVVILREKLSSLGLLNSTS